MGSRPAKALGAGHGGGDQLATEPVLCARDGFDHRSALHPQFQRYELYFTPEPGENWVFIGDAVTNPVNNGLLGAWETAGLPDGNYSLRLRVVRQDGNYDEGFARNITVANRTAPTPTPTDTPAEFPTLPPAIEGVFTPTPIAEATLTPVTVEQPEIRPQHPSPRLRRHRRPINRPPSRRTTARPMTASAVDWATSSMLPVSAAPSPAAS